MPEEPDVRVFEILVEPGWWAFVYKVLESKGLHLRDLTPGLIDTPEYEAGVRTFVVERK